MHANCVLGSGFYPKKLPLRLETGETIRFPNKICK